MNTKITIRITVLLFIILTVFTASYRPHKKPDPNSTIQNTNELVGDTVAEIGHSIRCIFQDAKNNFWFTTDGEGVFKYNGKTITQFTNKHGLISNYVWNAQEDKKGNIWFKTRDGICYFDGKAFVTKQVDENILQRLNYNYSNDELLPEYYYNGKSLIKIQLPNTSPLTNNNNARFHYDIYSTYKDSKGNIWFGTCTAGVCKYDGNTYTWLDDEALGAPVRCIFEDKDGIIWIGNNGYGLLRYDGKTLTNFTKEKNLENPDFMKDFTSKARTMARVWAITDDKDGNLWIGTYDAGVWKFDGTTLTNFTRKDGLGNEAIWTIYKDKTGKLWFGTDGGGVYTFNGKMFEWFKGR